MKFSTLPLARCSFVWKSMWTLFLLAWLGSVTSTRSQSLPAQISHKIEPINAFSLWSNQPIKLTLDGENQTQLASTISKGQSAAAISGENMKSRNASLSQDTQFAAAVPSGDDTKSLNASPLLGSQSITINLDGAPSSNELSDPANHLIIFDLDPGLVVVEIEFDIRGLLNDHVLGSHSTSHASDARIRVSSSDSLVLFDYQPYSVAGFAHPTALEPADLAGHYRDVLGLPWTVPASGGSLTFEFYEIFDDDSAIVDGLYTNGSRIRITVIPEPRMMALLAFSGAAFVAGHRSRASKRPS